MAKWIGRVCITLGVICLLCSVGLFLYNRWEDAKAGETGQRFLAQIQDRIYMASETPVTSENVNGEYDRQNPEPTQEQTESISTEMATVSIEGYDAIGILSIPDLELELPVLKGWSYEKLKKAPCHYFGSYYEGNFVIAAHNYTSHFGRLSELRTGDRVFFTDVKGNVYHYEVVLLETLPKEATETMIASGFDLSLYTCTLGGGSRVTVRCNRIQTENNVQ